MSLSPKSIDLLDGVLEQGIAIVAIYLKKTINKPIIIMDGIGQIYFPENSGVNSLYEEICDKIFSNISENEHYYNEEDKCLYYQVGKNSHRAFVIIKNINQEHIPQAVSSINEARLAIKTYFVNLEKVRTNTEKFERKFTEHLFVRSNANIRDIIKIHDIDLDIKQPYCVKLVQVDKKFAEEFDLRLLCEDIKTYVKRRGLEIIRPLIWGDGVMFILPAVYLPDTLKIDPEWPKIIDSLLWKNDADKKFNINISIGIGRKYTLQELHKSYFEAHISLIIPRLLGQPGVVRRFGDLGVFSHVFSQDIESVKDYTVKNLGALFQYDKKNEAELFQTLRIILDNCCNWKLSADKLFIHVNTLHYRLAKIEQILDVDFSEMYTRTNLFVLIKVWDTLRILGFMDDQAKQDPLFKGGKL